MHIQKLLRTTKGNKKLAASKAYSIPPPPQCADQNQVNLSALLTTIQNVHWTKIGRVQNAVYL